MLPKSPLHITFFNRSFYPDTSATGQLLTELCEGLVERHGCRVSVITGMPLIVLSGQDGNYGRGILFDHQQYKGIEIFRARGTRFSKKHFAGRACNYVTYFLSASATGLFAEKPDVVVALTDPPIIGLSAWLASRRYHVPFVMSYRDVFPEVARLLEDFQSPAVERMLHQVNRFLVKKADKVIALGETMRKRLIDGKGADPARTLVIPDWADCDAIQPAPKRNVFSQEHGLADKFVVMHSGNIGLSQSLETVIEAASMLQQYRDLVFVFIGEGVKKSALQKKVSDLNLNNVLFLPYQPKERLIESFAAADIFIVSLKKGMSGYIVPSKLYSILAAGRAYVAAVEEDSEVVAITREYNCGVVATPENADDLSQNILMLYQNQNLVKQMSENARKAGEQFDRKIHVDHYYNLFCDIVENRRKQ